MRHALSLTTVATALLAACGGGDSTTPATARLGATERAQAVSAPALTASFGARELFDWAQFKYPELLAGAASDYPSSYLGVNYSVRAIASKNAYLGVTDAGEVFVLAPFTNNGLQGYGPLSGFAAQIRFDVCNVYPGSCGVAPGPLNACTMPASQVLAQGRRLALRYETSGAAAGSTEIDAVVDGPAQFEGQAAIRTSSTITMSAAGAGSTQISRAYQQIAAGDFTHTIGSESELTVAGKTESSRTIYQPPDLNAEHGLVVGQTHTKTTTGGTTTITPGQPSRISDFFDRKTFTFEAREPVTVRGKTYDSCRYRSTTPAGENTVQWLVVGKGVAARIQSLDGSNTTTTDLVSGSLNGAPI